MIVHSFANTIHLENVLRGNDIQGYCVVPIGKLRLNAHVHPYADAHMIPSIQSQCIFKQCYHRSKVQGSHLLWSQFTYESPDYDIVVLGMYSRLIY